MFWTNIFRHKKGGLSDGVNVPAEKTTDVPRSWSAVLSDTDKNENQDACGRFFDESTGTTIIAVADGIGSSKNVAVGSRFVVDKALELISLELKSSMTLDYADIFARIQTELTEMVECDYAEQLETMDRKDFGTTLIIGVDTRDTFTLAYIGNGCAYYMMGDLVKFPRLFYLPWNVNNLLVPHTLPDEITGRETLCKYFSYRPALVDQCVPTVITVSKNHHAGELFVIGTDGLDSLDKHDEFAFCHDELMMTSSWNMALFCDIIKSTLTIPSRLSDDMLADMLKKYMDSLRSEKRMDDDTTVGIIVSSGFFCNNAVDD